MALSQQKRRTGSRPRTKIPVPEGGPGTLMPIHSLPEKGLGSSLTYEVISSDLRRPG